MVEKHFYTVTGFVPSNYPPVIVSLHEGDLLNQSFPLMRVDALEGGLPRIQVDLAMSGENKQSPADGRLLLEALALREYYAGKAPEAGRSIPSFPPWFAHGLYRLCFEPERDDKPLTATFLTGGSPPGIDDFLRERPPEDDNHLLVANYDNRAACLLQAGLHGVGGASFREWIGHEGSTNDFPTISFPSGWEKGRIQREWLLLMAASSRDQGSTTKILSSSDSLRKYDEIMNEILKDPDTASKILVDKKKGGDFRSRELCSRLIALQTQANPVILPLIVQTVELLQRAQKISPKKFLELIDGIMAERQVILACSKDIESYLDWYEATKVPVSSGLFDSYLKSPETSVRKGPVGHYLDQVEARGW